MKLAEKLLIGTIALTGACEEMDLGQADSETGTEQVSSTCRPEDIRYLTITSVSGVANLRLLSVDGEQVDFQDPIVPGDVLEYEYCANDMNANFEFNIRTGIDPAVISFGPEEWTDLRAWNDTGSVFGSRAITISFDPHVNEDFNLDLEAWQF
jgi:hypothetical protein